MIAYLCFTKGGLGLAETLSQKNPGRIIYNREEKIKPLMAELWALKALVFISASGIAVRYIAPYVKDKAKDPAVIVIDEGGTYAISLLSGHLGGANELARDLARLVGAEPVITTASEVKGLESIDSYAQRMNLVIEDLSSLAKVMGPLVDGAPLFIYGQSHYPYDNLTNLEGAQVVLVQSDELVSFDKPTAVLRPRSLVLGLGAKKGVTCQAVGRAISGALKELGLAEGSVYRVNSIDLKKEEQGILDFCQEKGLEFFTYSAQELDQVKGDFEESDFVRSVTGLGSVSSRAALAEGGDLLLDKYVLDGVTVSVARREDG